VFYVDFGFEPIFTYDQANQKKVAPKVSNLFKILIWFERTYKLWHFDGKVFSAYLIQIASFFDQFFCQII
jgi:hypothetical protein